MEESDRLVKWFSEDIDQLAQKAKHSAKEGDLDSSDYLSRAQIHNETQRSSAHFKVMYNNGTEANFFYIRAEYGPEEVIRTQFKLQRYQASPPLPWTTIGEFPSHTTMGEGYTWPHVDEYARLSTHGHKHAWRNGLRRVLLQHGTQPKAMVRTHSIRAAIHNALHATETGRIMSGLMSRGSSSKTALASSYGYQLHWMTSQPAKKGDYYCQRPGSRFTYLHKPTDFQDHIRASEGTSWASLSHAQKQRMPYGHEADDRGMLYYDRQDLRSFIVVTAETMEALRHRFSPQYPQGFVLSSKFGGLPAISASAAFVSNKELLDFLTSQRGSPGFAVQTFRSIGIFVKQIQANCNTILNRPLPSNRMHANLEYLLYLYCTDENEIEPVRTIAMGDAFAVSRNSEAIYTMTQQDLAANFVPAPDAKDAWIDASTLQFALLDVAVEVETDDVPLEADHGGQGQGGQLRRASHGQELPPTPPHPCEEGEGTPPEKIMV